VTALVDGKLGEDRRRRDHDVGAAHGVRDRRAADHERAAVGEAAEDLPRGHVERDRQDLRDPVAGANAEVTGAR
jgi:hypothetical protein